MTHRTVIRSAEGAIINIGPWDLGVETKIDVKTGERVEVIGNPMPAGAYEDEADIVQGWDGGLYEASDPRRLAPA